MTKPAKSSKLARMARVNLFQDQIKHKKMGTPEDRATELMLQFIGISPNLASARVNATICVGQIVKSLTEYGDISMELQNMGGEFRYYDLVLKAISTWTLEAIKQREPNQKAVPNIPQILNQSRCLSHAIDMAFSSIVDATTARYLCKNIDTRLPSKEQAISNLMKDVSQWLLWPLPPEP